MPSKQYEEERAKFLARVRAGLEEPTVAVYVFPMGDDAVNDALVFAKRVRSAGVSCVVDTRDVKLKKKFQWAEEELAYFVVVIGDAERAAGNVNVKDMDTRMGAPRLPDDAIALFVREARQHSRLR